MHFIVTRIPNQDFLVQLLGCHKLISLRVFNLTVLVIVLKITFLQNKKAIHDVENCFKFLLFIICKGFIGLLWSA